MEQIRNLMRPTDVPDTGLLCDLLWADPDKDQKGWGARQDAAAAAARLRAARHRAAARLAGHRAPPPIWVLTEGVSRCAPLFSARA